jgi:hypothetical protein
MKITSILSAVLIALFSVSAQAESCCDKAKAAGKTCEHPCCVKATKEGKVCEKCNKKTEEKK